MAGSRRLRCIRSDRSLRGVDRPVLQFVCHCLIRPRRRTSEMPSDDRGSSTRSVAAKARCTTCRSATAADR